MDKNQMELEEKNEKKSRFEWIKFDFWVMEFNIQFRQLLLKSNNRCWKMIKI